MCEESSAQMKAFLVERKLAHLWKDIYDNGYDNFDFLCSMDEEEVRTMLMDIGITKIGHIRLFLKAWKSVNSENSIKISHPGSSRKTTVMATSSAASGSKNSPIEELECIVKLSEQESIENFYLEKSILRLPCDPIMVNPSVHESIVYPSLQRSVLNPSLKGSTVNTLSIESPPVENAPIPTPSVESILVPPVEKEKIDAHVEKCGGKSRVRKSPVNSDVVILDSPVSSRTESPVKPISPHPASPNTQLTDTESTSDITAVELSIKEENSEEHTGNPTAEPSTSLQSNCIKVEDCIKVEVDPEIISLSNNSNSVKYSKKSLETEASRAAIGKGTQTKRSHHFGTKYRGFNNTSRSEGAEIREVHKRELEEKVKRPKSEGAEIREIHQRQLDEKAKRHKIERYEKLELHERQRDRMLKMHKSARDNLLRMHEDDDDILD